jgi:hypothetical protein
MVAEKLVITFELDPETLANSLPISFLREHGIQNPRTGFSDQPLVVPYKDKDLMYDLSYDGEGELIAVVLEMPKNMTERAAIRNLEEYLDVQRTTPVMEEEYDEEDEEDDEDEEEDEEDEED